MGPNLGALMQGAGAGGPPPAAAGAGAGIPPQIAALLAGAGGPPGQPQAAPSPPGGGKPTDALAAALDALRSYIQREPDQQHKLLVEKCTTIIQQILAEEQQMHDGAMGGTADPRLMRKAGAY